MKVITKDFGLYFVCAYALLNPLFGQISSGSNYTLVNQASRLALDNGASTTNGTKIQQWACNGATQQNWKLTAVGGNAYTIVNQQSGKALDDTNASTSNGTIMQQWSVNGQQQQNWVATAVGGGAYTLVNQLSQKALDGTGGSLANGTLIQQYSSNGQAQQNWTLVPAGSCSYRGFNILIDTNQMNNSEAQQATQLAADGTWAVVVNSCSGCGGVSTPIPASSWPGILSTLNAQSWSISEDIYGDWMTPGTANYSLVKSYLGNVGLSLNVTMDYQECGTYGVPSPCPAYVPTLTSSSIDTANTQIGTPIIVDNRAYNSNGQPAVQAALANSHCSGVSFETNPKYSTVSGSASISNGNFSRGFRPFSLLAERLISYLPRKLRTPMELPEIIKPTFRVA